FHSFSPNCYNVPVYADRGPTGKANQEPYSCVQLTNRYFATHNSIYPEHARDADQIFRGLINCSETCSREWSMQNVIGTNLQLLVAEVACETCSEWEEEVPRGPVEDTGPDVCEEALHPKYRRQQDRCPAEVHPHDILACTSPGLTKPMITLFVFVVVLLHKMLV
ncbi:hypothetical protein FBUS_03656, partial [Fasciolopsis buskii]